MNEAYEILSNPAKRAAYDWLAEENIKFADASYLSGLRSKINPDEIEEFTPIVSSESKKTIYLNILNQEPLFSEMDEKLKQKIYKFVIASPEWTETLYNILGDSNEDTPRQSVGFLNFFRHIFRNKKQERKRAAFLEIVGEISEQEKKYKRNRVVQEYFESHNRREWLKDPLYVQDVCNLLADNGLNGKACRHCMELYKDDNYVDSKRPVKVDAKQVDLYIDFNTRLYKSRSNICAMLAVVFGVLSGGWFYFKKKLFDEKSKFFKSRRKLKAFVKFIEEAELDIRLIVIPTTLLVLAVPYLRYFGRQALQSNLSEAGF